MLLFQAKRERANSGGSTLGRRSGSPRPPTSPRTPSPSDRASSSLATTSKPEEMLWYHRAITMSQILRYLTFGDSQVSAAGFGS